MIVPDAYRAQLYLRRLTVGLEDSNLCAALSAVGDLEELPVVGNNARGATASIVASPRRSCGHSSRFDRVQLRDRVTFPCSGGTSESTPEHLADALVVDRGDETSTACGRPPEEHG